MHISGLLANNPLCREIDGQFPENSNGRISTLNLCCVKVVCATLTDDEGNEFHHAENEKTSNAAPSTLDTSSSLKNDKELVLSLIHI